jgi:uncharacterized protein Veg
MAGNDKFRKVWYCLSFDFSAENGKKKKNQEEGGLKFVYYFEFLINYYRGNITFETGFKSL